MNSNIKRLNKLLAERFGTIIVGKDGAGATWRGSDVSKRPTFRLIWSESELEKRIGTYNVFYGNIYIRTERGMLEVRKYGYIKERYILERLVHMPNRELVESDKGHYECVHVFQDKHGNYLKPLWRPLEYICNRLLYGRVTPKNALMLEGEALSEEEKEVREFMDYLNQESTPLGAALHDKEATSFANLDAKQLIQNG